MNNPPKKPTERDREYLQAELTRMVGIGRIDLDTFQNLVDTALSAEDTSVLAQIHARYIGPPPGEWDPPPPQNPGHPPAPPPAQQPRSFQTGAIPPQNQPPQSHQPPYPQYPGAVPAPQHSYPPQPQSHFAAQPQHQREFSSTMGTIKRSGQWLVPEHCVFKLNGATLDLDLREASAAGPVITMELRATAATIKIVVPPGVHVHNQLKETWTDSQVNVTAPSPGAPRVVLTGFARGSTVAVVTRAIGGQSFWEKFFG